jgi:hypothetical protein
MKLRKIGWVGMHWTADSEQGAVEGPCEHGKEHSGSMLIKDSAM